jgi:uncharacterized SAM-binding protein YcdF (DUF218 family)
MIRWLRGLALILIVVLAYPSWLAFQVWQQSHRDEVHSADAIVVLGAAQYDGKPSPILKARLDHALYLFNEDVSGKFIVTGGKQSGDRFTEAEAARSYLAENGVASERILEEERGRTTYQSLRQVADIARRESIDSVLLVSDPLHSERVKRMAMDLGFDEAYTSPASYVQLRRSRETKARELVREVASLLVYELLER